jgi:hypothetical protein
MLTKRGYKVSKASLTEQEDLRNELLIRPVSSSHQSTPEPFSVLRESLTDFYLPDCYSKYESPETKSKFPDHTTIDVPFSGSLRPIQKDVVNASPGS